MIIVREVEMAQFQFFLPETLDLIGVIEPTVTYSHEDALAFKTCFVQRLEIIGCQLVIGVGLHDFRHLLKPARTAFRQIEVRFAVIAGHLYVRHAIEICYFGSCFFVHFNGSAVKPTTPM